VRLGGAIEWYCGIWEANEDKTSKNPLVVGAWRVQVLWVD